MSRGIKLTLLGIASLILGLYLYFFERSGFLIFNNIGSEKVLNIFGKLAYNLPSFLHAFSFSLFSIIILGTKRKWILFSCGFWFLLESAFELGQLPFFAEKIISLGFSRYSFIGRYFVYGTFDLLDLLAAFLGASLTLLLFSKELRIS